MKTELEALALAMIAVMVISVVVIIGAATDSLSGYHWGLLLLVPLLVELCWRVTTRWRKESREKEGQPLESNDKEAALAWANWIRTMIEMQLSAAAISSELSQFRDKMKIIAAQEAGKRAAEEAEQILKELKE